MCPYRLLQKMKGIILTQQFNVTVITHSKLSSKGIYTIPFSEQHSNRFYL
jgi:hypothetical protein